MDEALIAAAPKPTAEEEAAGAAFEAAMWALARPGLVQQAPPPAMRSVIRALIDRECRAFADDPAIAAALADVGATLTGPEAAEFAFLDLAQEAAAAQVAALPVGSDLYPDRGATIIASARFEAGAPRRVSGPGVDGALDIRIAGPSEAFWAARAAAIRYPLGLDLFLIDGDAIVGLPRSSVVEAL